MQITLLAIGSRGDIQPLIALGVGFKQAGYEVQLGAPANFQNIIEQYGLVFFCIAPDFTKVMASETGHRMMTAGENAILYLDCMAKIAESFYEQMMESTWRACQGTDAIIYSSLSQVGYLLGKKLGIPTWATWIYPIGRTRHFPLVGTPNWLSLGKAYNRSTYFIFEQISQYFTRYLFTAWRERFDLEPLPFPGFFEALIRDQIPFLYAYSERVMPRPPDWPAWFYNTGYWFLDHLPNWKPPATLVDFLQNGPPPVYVGFGSMRDHDAKKLAQLVLQSIKMSGQRAILVKGWGGLTPDQFLGDDIFFIDRAPHDWLFPKMAAVVHHGGAGTTAAGLRAGIPAVIVPFSGDQPFWAKRLAQLGTAPKSVPYTRLSAPKLAKAILTVISDQQMQQRAASLSQQIQAEDGVARAIEAFESSFATR